LGLVRARFGEAASSGVPTQFHWEVLSPTGRSCDEDGVWTTADATEEDDGDANDASAIMPPHRSWFLDADACALRLVIDRAHGGPPALSEVRIVPSARDVLRDAVASDDGATPGFSASNAIAGTYARRWMGSAAKQRWTLTLRLAEPAVLDRVRLVLGSHATSHPRGELGAPGRTYAIADAPIRYTLEGTDDDVHWRRLGTTPLRRDGSILPLRRRLIRFDTARPLRALRLVMRGATDGDGLADAKAAPIVREIAAYRAGDDRPLLLSPWVLSINANPSSQTHTLRGGELANDAYFAKFLQQRFGAVLPTLARDDRVARTLGSHGELLTPTPSEHDGEALESIEGDDPQLDAHFLSSMSPPPLVVLSGSNDWDYAAETRRTRTSAGVRWQWDPMLPARSGGLGQLARVVKDRRAPVLGFCGGAQLIALLESESSSFDAIGLDQRTLDAVVRRTTGAPVRWFATPSALERSWPGEDDARAVIAFDPHDRFFRDLASDEGRATSRAFPESHADAVRPSAFLPGGPLAHLEIVATSDFCGAGVVDAGPFDPAYTNPSGPGRCVATPEVFRARDGRWPVVGVQAHAERPVEFATAAEGEPAASVADPLLFIAALYEDVVDAYLRNAIARAPYVKDAGTPRVSAGRTSDTARRAVVE
ncbi:MAG: hypothetical protein ACHREM_22930, partial [Polyangiales bacterium]